MIKRLDKPMTGRDFDRLTPEQKEAVYQECERIGPGSGVPLTPEQEAQHSRFMKKAGSKKKVAQRVQVSLEKALLKAADRFAAEHGMSRSEMIEQGIRKLLAS